ncbi:MAG TPA: ACP phosphodiesterase [Spirochaetaceae bacterium]|nr:ACP phosphodiesterase [Spirochaetaceae bacterium]
MILFVNACVREKSRTKRLADALLEKLGDDVTELRLSCASFPAVDEKFLNVRDELIASGDFGNPMFYLARQFASADEIVIAAPYWDLSFPAVLKQYFEHVNVLGITFEYTPDGYPKGLCKAKSLHYVTTAGGSFVPDDFGFGYVKALAQNFYGIGRVELIKAEGLDIQGAEPDKILENVISNIKNSK